MPRQTHGRDARAISNQQNRFWYHNSVCRPWLGVARASRPWFGYVRELMAEYTKLEYARARDEENSPRGVTPRSLTCRPHVRSLHGDTSYS
jgi:hypothetical protein